MVDGGGSMLKSAIWRAQTYVKSKKCGLCCKYGDVGPQNSLTNILKADILPNYEG